MKTPEKWEHELANTEELPEFVDFIREVQEDALTSQFSNTTQEEEFNIAKGQCEKLELDVELWKEEAKRMRDKWHEARRHLRAANKGAQRNSVALRLATTQYYDLINSDKRWKERDLGDHKAIVWNWLIRSDEELSEKIGCNSGQITACRAMLKAMLGTSLLKRI